MSSIGPALRARFDQVCSSELHRLRRKTATLHPVVQAEVVAMSFAVARAVVAQLEAGLNDPRAEGLGDIVARLFAIAPGSEPIVPQRDTRLRSASSKEQS